jgi:hypothetical protein
MKNILSFICIVILLILMVGCSKSSQKSRMIVLTDIGGDPDDQQSMVRLMLYSNEFNIEGLIASASGTPGELGENVVKPHLIREIVEAYGQVRPNLLLHKKDYPECGSLTSEIRIKNRFKKEALVYIPEVTEPGTFHIILKITDTGIPPLCAYQRIIFAIEPAS